MKIDYSNKRNISIIAGILTAILASIFVAIALGVAGCHLFNNETIEAYGIGMPPVSENNIPLTDFSEDGISISKNPDNKRVVSIAQEVDCAADTQVGYINLLGENIPSQLPFCIEDTTVAGWHMFIESYGGYTPIMDPAAWEAINGVPDGMRGVHQFDILTKDGYATCGNTYIGYGLNFVDVSTDPAYIQMLYDEYDVVWDKICCCHKLYYVTIDTSCNNMGCIDSWYYPDLNFGSCTAVMRSYTDDEVGVDSTMNIPGKQPSIEIKMTWCGCDEVDQCFVLILTQKNFINGIPNSRFSIYIAS
jgi:hypothetical protein